MESFLPHDDMFIMKSTVLLVQGQDTVRAYLTLHMVYILKSSVGIEFYSINCINLSNLLRRHLRTRLFYLHFWPNFTFWSIWKIDTMFYLHTKIGTSLKCIMADISCSFMFYIQNKLCRAFYIILTPQFILSPLQPMRHYYFGHMILEIEQNWPELVENHFVLRVMAASCYW